MVEFRNVYRFFGGARIGGGRNLCYNADMLLIGEPVACADAIAYNCKTINNLTGEDYE